MRLVQELFMNWLLFSFTYRWCLFSISLTALFAIPQAVVSVTVSTTRQSNAYSIMITVIILLLLLSVYNSLNIIIICLQMLLICLWSNITSTFLSQSDPHLMRSQRHICTCPIQFHVAWCSCSDSLFS